MDETPATSAATHSASAVAKRPTERAIDPESRSRIFPYEPPRALAANLWQVKGSLAIPGVPRNMTIHRLADGRLILYSVIAMHEDGMRALEALGEPAIMVIPHDRHQMDAPFYRLRYPRLHVVAPEPARETRVPIDAGLEGLTSLGVRAYPLPGTSYHEAILELPIAGGVALCTCELLGNAAGVGGLLGLAMRWLGPPGGGFGVSRAVRWREVTDRAAVRRWLEELAQREDIGMILVGHGEPVIRDARAALRQAADRA